MIKSSVPGGIIFSTGSALGSKKMKFTTYDKNGRVHHTIHLDEGQLRFLMDNIKYALGEVENND